MTTVYKGKSKGGKRKYYQKASKPPLKFSCIEHHKHIHCVNYVVQKQDIYMSPSTAKKQWSP